MKKIVLLMALLAAFASVNMPTLGKVLGFGPTVAYAQGDQGEDEDPGDQGEDQP
jgi:hypothetical protein